MVGAIGKVGTVAGNGTNGTAVVTNAGNFNIGVLSLPPLY